MMVSKDKEGNVRRARRAQRQISELVGSVRSDVIINQ
jgi:hypothetical protein